MFNKPSLKLILKTLSELHAIAYILHTSLFPGMINMHIGGNILVFPSDELIIYLCVKCF